MKTESVNFEEQNVGHGNEIEWQFDEDDNECEGGEAGEFTDLKAMSISDELSEIAIPLTHPIGAASIQILGISAGLEFTTSHSGETRTTIMDTNTGRCLFAATVILILFTCICMKYRLPRYAAWMPILIIALAAWLAIEWSLFQT